MPLLLLLLLMLVTLHDAWPNPLGLDPAHSCFATLSGFGVLVLAMEFLNLLTRRALRRDPSKRSVIMRRYSRCKRWQLIGLVSFLFAALYLLGWGDAIQRAQEVFPAPGLRIVLLLPFVIALMIGWLGQYDVDRLHADMVHYPFLASFPGRWSYFGLQARHNLLFVLPPMVLLIAHESLLRFVPSLEDSRNSLLVALIGIGMLGVALMVMPLFLRLFLGLKPLGPGPLRERLTAKASAIGFRFSNVLVWNTRNGVANAMVTGVLPWLRYVVITDRLMEELNEDEIEAVFGHEFGHMKHHHMFFYMVFIVSSLMLMGGLWSAGAYWLQDLEAPAWLTSIVDAAAWHSVAVWVILAVVAAYILIVFGWLSRRCERQADIFGCKTASPAAFISALEKVADLNGISRERPGFFSWWQHSTIADRIDFIRRMETDPALEPVFQRRLRLTKWSLALGLIGLVALLYALLPRDVLNFSNFGARIVSRELCDEKAMGDASRLVTGAVLRRIDDPDGSHGAVAASRRG